MSTIGLDEFNRRMGAMSDQVSRNTDRALLKNALRMEFEAKTNATSFPRRRTGRLFNSISGQLLNYNGDKFIVLRAGGRSSEITKPFSESADVVYAGVLEFGGTTNGLNFIQPRKYLERGRNKVLPQLRSDLSAALNAALNGKDYV